MERPLQDLAHDRLASEGLDAGSWSNAPGDRYDVHEYPYDKVLVCARGSIVFALPELGERVELTAGDRLDLPAGTAHGATVGSGGVVCLEAHLPRGSLAARPRRQGGWLASRSRAGGETARTAEP